MSINYENSASGMNGASVTDSEMLTAVPIWETRGKKRRGMSRSMTSTAASEPRSFADDDRRTDGDATLAAASADPYVTEPMMAEPAFASAPPRTVVRGNGPAPALVAGGAIAVLALAAAGWYGLRPHDNGVVELTPGAAAPVETASSDGLDSATNTLPAEPAGKTVTVRASAPVPAERVETPTRMASARPTAARVRPAANAATAGVNASTTAAIPASPQPYRALNPSVDSSTATVNPAPAAPPVEAAPPVTAEAPATQPPPTDTPTPQPAPTPQ